VFLYQTFLGLRLVNKMLTDVSVGLLHATFFLNVNIDPDDGGDVLPKRQTT
jgi:hypothetical protein